MRKGDVVEVEWRDSVIRGRWDSEEEYQKWSASAERLVHTSTSYLFSQTPLALVLIQSRCDFEDGDTSVADGILIPRSAVLRTHVLRRA